MEFWKAWCLLAHQWTYLIGFTESTEYCLVDTFSSQCNDSEIVFIQSARYGRMFAERCISAAYGPLDCYRDILLELDDRCSGKDQCRVPVVEISRMYADFRVCPDGTSTFMEVEHRCLKVEWFPQCDNRTQAIQEDRAFVSSSTIYRTRAGLQGCALNVRGKPGQRIELRFYDFTLYKVISQLRNDLGSAFVCPFHLVIDEGGGADVVVSLCDTSVREKVIYLSSSNVMDFYMVDNVTTAEREQPRYLFYYEVIHCPSLEIPPNSTVEYYNNGATVRCSLTSEVWYLVCSGTQWRGIIGNCTATDTGPGDGRGSGGKSGTAFPFGHDNLSGILIAVGIGTGIGIVVGLLLLGIVLGIRRCVSRRKKARKNPMHTLSKIELPVPAGQMKVGYEPAYSTAPHRPQPPHTYARHESFVRGGSLRGSLYRPHPKDCMSHPDIDHSIPGPSTTQPDPLYHPPSTSFSGDYDKISESSSMQSLAPQQGKVEMFQPRLGEHTYERNLNSGKGKGSLKKSLTAEYLDINKSKKALAKGDKIYDGKENLSEVLEVPLSSADTCL